MRKNVASAASVEDECGMMGLCRCGGEWKLTFNEVALRERMWVDYIAMRCVRCDFLASFEFDISRFFEPRPGVWGRRLAAGRLKVSRLGRLPVAQPAMAAMVRAVA